MNPDQPAARQAPYPHYYGVSPLKEKQFNSFSILTHEINYVSLFVLPGKEPEAEVLGHLWVQIKAPNWISHSHTYGDNSESCWAGFQLAHGRMGVGRDRAEAGVVV